MINLSIGNWNCLLPTSLSTKDQQMILNLALLVLDSRLPLKHTITIHIIIPDEMYLEYVSQGQGS